MLRLTLALSSLAATVAALSEGASELQNSLRLQANPTWLKATYYGVSTDVTCSSTPEYIGGGQVGVCENQGTSSQMVEYVSATSFAVKTFITADCSGTSTVQTALFTPTGLGVVTCSPLNPTCCLSVFDSTEMVVYSWEYSQPLFAGGAIENVYSTAAACKAKTATAIARSFSYPWTTKCLLQSTGTYMKLTYGVDQYTATSSYPTALCTASVPPGPTCKSCDTSNILCPTDNDLRSYGITPAASDDDDVCLSGGETLLLETGSVIAMDSVQVGDRVQVASASDGSLSFAEVIFLPHERNDKLSNFIEVQTATASLRATPSHLVMAGSCGTNDMVLTRVEDISVGDCMDSVSGEDVVIASEKSLGRGVYSVVTSHADGIIVVNGFKASSFAVSHVVVNNYYQIHRTIYAHFPAVIKALAGLGQLLGSIGACVISA